MAVRFDPEVLVTDPGPRSTALAVLAAGLAAVEPEAAVSRHLRREAGSIVVAGHALPEPRGDVMVLALGKAAAAMGRAAMSALTGLSVTGVVVAPEPVVVPGLESYPGEHPVPGPRSRRAGGRLLTLARSAGRDDLVLVLLSGGGSALAEVPAPGISPGELAAVVTDLVRSGLDITAVNTVRRHLSALKGGRLAVAAAPATIATLILSDVVGSPLEAIAGGPTVADPTAPGDALAILEESGISVPEAVRAVLQRADPPPPPPRGVVGIVADGPTAASAAAAAATAAGIDSVIPTEPLVGEARVAGVSLASRGASLEPGRMIVYTGETTVRVAGRGVGGRNHEVALAAGIALRNRPGVLVAALATDGTDGPSGAAGAIGDAGTTVRGGRLGWDAQRTLDENDSATYLGATGDQIRCGPTGTNVGDLTVVYRPATPGPAVV